MPIPQSNRDARFDRVEAIEDQRTKVATKEKPLGIIAAQ